MRAAALTRWPGCSSPDHFFSFSKAGSSPSVASWNWRGKGGAGARKKRQHGQRKRIAVVFAQGAADASCRAHVIRGHLFHSNVLRDGEGCTNISQACACGAVQRRRGLMLLQREKKAVVLIPGRPARQA